MALKQQPPSPEGLVPRIGPHTLRRRVLGMEIEMHPVVFPVSALLVILFVIVTAYVPRRALLLFGGLQDSIAAHFGWLYLASMTGFLLFTIWLACSRYGRIRLGPDDSQPAYPRWTWFAMLFSAGMGIGMLFFGVAEPMAHFLSPPKMNGSDLAAAREAMGITLFHWCLHPWGLYALVGLTLAYFGFRHELPLSFRSAFFPLLGKRIYGRWGDAVDVLALLATLFGLATSLGLGAKQVNAGLAFVFGIPQSTTVQVILIAVITTLAVGSLISGLNVGVRRLSEANMFLAGLLLLFVFVAGPTIYLLGATVANTGAYLTRVPHRSFLTSSYAGPQQSAWLAGWTIFYWGWWIAWSPFVGMFIARISRGRTIREFVAGVLLVPSTVAVLWMTGFGNTALHQELASRVAATDIVEGASQASVTPGLQTYQVQVLDQATGLPQTPDGNWLVGPDAKAIASPRGVLMRWTDDRLITKEGDTVEYDRGVLVDAQSRAPYEPSEESLYRGPFQAESVALSIGGYLSQPVLNDDAMAKADTTATAMFVMLQGLPLGWLTALVGTLCVVLFFVTSSDSASFVADMIASGGSQNPTLGTRLFWGILEGLLAAVLLIAGGLKALQTGAITIGLPFCLLIICMAYSLLLALRQEPETAFEDAAEPAEEQGERQLLRDELVEA